MGYEAVVDGKFQRFFSQVVSYEKKVKITYSQDNFGKGGNGTRFERSDW